MRGAGDPGAGVSRREEREARSATGAAVGHAARGRPPLAERSVETRAVGKPPKRSFCSRYPWGGPSW